METPTLLLIAASCLFILYMVVLRYAFRIKKDIDNEVKKMQEDEVSGSWSENLFN